MYCAIQGKEIYPLNGVIHPLNYLGLGILASLRFCLLQALAGKTGQIALKKYNIRWLWQCTFSFIVAYLSFIITREFGSFEKYTKGFGMKMLQLVRISKLLTTLLYLNGKKLGDTQSKNLSSRMNYEHFVLDGLRARKRSGKGRTGYCVSSRSL